MRMRYTNLLAYLFTYLPECWCVVGAVEGRNCGELLMMLTTVTLITSSCPPVLRWC